MASVSQSVQWDATCLEDVFVFKCLICIGSHWHHWVHFYRVLSWALCFSWALGVRVPPVPT